MTKHLIKVLSLKGTREILEYLNQHKRAQLTDMKVLINVPSLSNRLHDLLGLKLINHHFERMEKRREWYEITENGRKTLRLLKEIDKFESQL